MRGHPRTLGRAWLSAPVVAPRTTIDPQPAPIATRAPRPVTPQLALVPTADELARQLGLVVHRLSAAETAAWFAVDPELQAETRRAIREAVRDRGGGELRDHRGRMIERIGDSEPR